MTRMTAYLHGNEHGPDGPGRFERVDDEHGEVRLEGGPDEKTRLRVKYTENTRSINYEFTYEVIYPGLATDADFIAFLGDAMKLGKGAIENIPVFRQHRKEVEAQFVVTASQPLVEEEDNGG